MGVPECFEMEPTAFFSYPRQLTVSVDAMPLLRPGDDDRQSGREVTINYLSLCCGPFVSF